MQSRSATQKLYREIRDSATHCTSRKSSNAPSNIDIDLQLSSSSRAMRSQGPFTDPPSCLPEHLSGFEAFYILQATVEVPHFVKRNEN